MNTLIQAIQMYYIFLIIGLGIAAVIMWPVTLLAFGFGATIQGVALAVATPYVLVVVLPAITVAGFAFADLLSPRRY